MEDERIVGGIPFPDDLLFHFFNKDTIITDEYIQDPISGLKMYPKKSGAVKPTALSTGLKLPNSELDLIGKVEVFLHHKLADVENFGFIWAGQNTNSPYGTTALYLTSGKVGYSTMFKGSAAASCIILSSALQDDNYYIITSDFNTSNVTMKANKVTIVNNAVVIGNNINGSTTAKGTETLTADIGILSGRDNTSYVYSSKHKVIWVKFYNKSGALMHEFNFSEGAGEQTFDTVTGNAYPISNINPDLFWNYTQDFNHYNFRYGFTLYQKAGADDIRVPNKKDGSEITPASIPSGYSRIANYKECRQTFNQCENVFKLDNTTVATVLRCATAGTADAIGDYVYNSATSRWVNTTTGAYIYLQGGTEWYWKNAANTLLYYGYASTSPANVVAWYRSGGAAPAPSQLQSVLITSDLYNADPDFVLFTENTGVAKEINVGTLDVNIGIDRGYLYINPNPEEKNFMLYKTNKTLLNDVKVIKYIGLKDEIVTDENGDVVYDENDHTILE